MNNLLIGLLGAWMSTNQPAALSNLVAVSTGLAIRVGDPNDPVEQQLAKLMADDNAAQEEVDQWIKDNDAFAAKGAGITRGALNRRILDRFAPIRQRYEEFIRLHPGHPKARVAFASFLGDLNDEDGAQEQLEKAVALNEKDPAIFNNLANIYAHNGSVTNAFEYYARASELSPAEPLYYHNLGNAVFLFRKDAMEYYHITEQEVFTKALELLHRALERDPENFPLATDVAQTYYGVKPPRTDESLGAWTNALSLAHDQIEREGTYIHLARVKISAGRFVEARAHLDAVTLPMYDDLKRRVGRSLSDKESGKGATNGAPAGN